MSEQIDDPFPADQMRSADDDQSLVSSSKKILDLRKPISIPFGDQLRIDLRIFFEALQKHFAQLLLLASGPGTDDLFEFCLKLIQLFQCLQ